MYHTLENQSEAMKFETYFECHHTVLHSWSLLFIISFVLSLSVQCTWRYLPLTNRCYGICKSTKSVTWYDAKRYCLSLGSQFASIHRMEENIFIGSLSEQYYQIMSLGQESLLIGKIF